MAGRIGPDPKEKPRLKLIIGHQAISCIILKRLLSGSLKETLLGRILNVSRGVWTLLRVENQPDSKRRAGFPFVCSHQYNYMTLFSKYSKNPLKNFRRKSGPQTDFLSTHFWV